jgi:hypothetical protein
MNFVVYNKLKYFPLEAYNENFSESFREKMLLLQCEVTMLAMKGDLEAAKGKLLEEMQTFTANSTRRDEGMVKNMKTYASDLVSHLRLRNTPKPLRVLVRLGYLHTNAYIQAQKAYKDNPDISITRVFDDKVTQYGVYDWIERALQHGKEIKDDWLQFGVLMEVLQQSSKITGKGDKFMIQLSKGKDLTAGEIGRLLADNAYKGQDLVQWADAVYDSTIDLIARKEKQQ